MTDSGDVGKALNKLIEAVAIASRRTIADVQDEAARFAWPEDDGVGHQEALIRFMCGRLIGAAKRLPAAAP